MKKTVRIFAAMISISMLLILCACSDSSYKQIQSTWRGTFDCTEAMNNELAVIIGVDSFDSGDATLEFTMNLTFNDDNTYYFEYDKEAIETSFNSYFDWLCGWMTDYMINQLMDQTGLGAENINALFLSEYGIDISEYVTSLMNESVNLDSLFIDTQTETSGYYKLEDNKIFLSPTSIAFDDSSYISYTLEDGVLTLTDIVGEHSAFWDDVNSSGSLPVSFTRS